jgi:sugar transferase (PEP-CTERM/EpsH1 system associated)
MTLHIQHILLSLQPGGLENGVVNVVNRLDPGRFQSSICCLKHGGEFTARLKPGVVVHEMGWKGGNDLWLPFRLARLFRQTRPDIVHTRNVESFYYAFLGAKLAGIPCIIHSEHGRTFNDRAIRFRVQRWFARHIQGMFSVSRQLKGELVERIGIPEADIQVLYNGVDLQRFGSGNRQAVRQQLGFSDADLVIGSVGRMVKVKNYQLLLSAVAALRRPDCVVMLVGEGPERSALETQAQALGIGQQVRFLGHRDDVTALLAAMDIFVLPSMNEGMSNTLLEAMASGVVSVASDVGGNPELVTDGQDGYIFPNEDLSALTGCLQRLCSDASLRRSLAEAGQARMQREFGIDAMIKRYEDLYTTTISNVRKARG